MFNKSFYLVLGEMLGENRKCWVNEIRFSTTNFQTLNYIINRNIIRKLWSSIL